MVRADGVLSAGKYFKMKNFEFQKADLWLAASLANAKDENFADREKRVAKGFERIAAREIYAQAQYLDQVLIPRIEQQRGQGSDYKFFREVFKSLLWAICLNDRNEYIEMRHAKNSLLLEFYKGHSEKLERQMNKYIAMEDLFLSSSLDVVAEGVAKRAADLLNK